MGDGMVLECKKCNYKADFYVGVGFAFFEDYQQTVKKVRSGKYGNEWKQFFDNNPGAAIIAEKQLYQCSGCNHLETDYDLSLYLNKKGTPPENGYWPHWCDFNHEYKFVKNYIHKCPKCSKRMHKVMDYDESKLICPECKSMLSIINWIKWD